MLGEGRDEGMIGGGCVWRSGFLFQYPVAAGPGLLRRLASRLAVPLSDEIAIFSELAPNLRLRVSTL